MVGLNGGSGFPWLGGRRDPGNRDNFLWSDGTPWDYSNWARGQPDDGKYLGQPDRLEECAHMWEAGHLPLAERHKWNDRPCSAGRTFVCKKGISFCDNLQLLGKVSK